jgi:hypothetical protein
MAELLTPEQGDLNHPGLDRTATSSEFIDPHNEPAHFEHGHHSDRHGPIDDDDSDVS